MFYKTIWVLVLAASSVSAATIGIHAGIGTPFTNLATQEGTGPRARIDLTGELGPVSLTAEGLFGGPNYRFSEVCDGPNYAQWDSEIGAAVRGGPVFGHRTMVGWDLRWDRVDTGDAFLLAAAVGQRYHPGRLEIGWHAGAGPKSIRRENDTYEYWKYVVCLGGVSLTRSLNSSVALDFNVELLVDAYIANHSYDRGVVVRFDVGPVFPL